MKKFASRMVMFVAALSVLSIAAFADGSKKDVSKKEVSFANEVSVNGTPVKAGTYVAVYDEGTGQLSIMKGNKTVASAAATLQKREKQGNEPIAYSTSSGALVSVGMNKGFEAILTGAGAPSSNTGQ